MFSRRSWAFGVQGLSRAAAVAIAVLSAACGGNGTQEAGKPVPVEVTRARAGAAVTPALYPGVIRPYRHVQLGFPLSGRLERVLVEEGAVVGRGDTLAVLERSRLAAAASAAAAARDQALRVYRRLSELRDGRATSEARLEEARSAWDVAEAGLREATQALEDAALRSPTSGEVVGEVLEEGTVVTPGMPVLSLARTDSLKAVVWVGDATRRRVLQGEMARVQPVAGNGFLEGEVSLASEVVERALGGYRVEVALSDTARVLRPGAAVEVELPLLAEGLGMRVPADALVARALGTSVFVVDGGRAREVAVEVIQLRGQEALVEGPINPGDTLIARGAEYVEDGTVVEVLR